MNCACDTCDERFSCWTTQRVFSNTHYQTLYEAYISQGLPHDIAVARVSVVAETANKTPIPNLDYILITDKEKEYEKMYGKGTKR